MDSFAVVLDGAEHLTHVVHGGEHDRDEQEGVLGTDPSEGRADGGSLHEHVEADEDGVGGDAEQLEEEGDEPDVLASGQEPHGVQSVDKTVSDHRKTRDDGDGGVLDDGGRVDDWGLEHACTLLDVGPASDGHDANADPEHEEGLVQVAQAVVRPVVVGKIVGLAAVQVVERSELESERHHGDADGRDEEAHEVVGLTASFGVPSTRGLDGEAGSHVVVPVEERLGDDHDDEVEPAEEEGEDERTHGQRRHLEVPGDRSEGDGEANGENRNQERRGGEFKTRREDLRGTAKVSLRLVEVAGDENDDALSSESDTGDGQDARSLVDLDLLNHAVPRTVERSSGSTNVGERWTLVDGHLHGGAGLHLAFFDAGWVAYRCHGL
mmetsp:Transcript_20795/g.42045  ORF Transcript_20795/g.42045 Transcript_20795/m.42045 type:complete len:380 (+) Transcript_20795:561-1700(+)